MRLISATMAVALLAGRGAGPNRAGPSTGRGVDGGHQITDCP